MSADLIARLIEAGTPAHLVAEVAMELGRASVDRGALEHRRQTERENSQRYRARGGDQIPGWMRREVFERDGYRCVDCGSNERLECDHAIPLAKGGDTSLDNLQTLCKPCNARKRDRIRKADKRGQTRTSSDEHGTDGGGRTGADIPLPLDKKAPQTPKKINPLPRVCVSRSREADPAEAIREAWNAMAERTGLSIVSKMTDERRKRIRARIAEHGADAFTEAIAAVERSPFCLGDSERGWQATFDFLLQPSSFTKLIEGSYDRKQSSGDRSRREQPYADRMRDPVLDLIARGVDP